MPRAITSDPRLCALLLSSLNACVGFVDEGPGACLANADQALFAGDPTFPQALTADPTRWPIGAMEGTNGSLYCTGVWVARRWLLTAAHCASGDIFRLAGTSGDGMPLSAPLGDAFAHPDVDMALIEVLAPERFEAAGVRPLALRWTPSDIAPRKAVLAGVGRDEDGQRGDLRFVEEPVVGEDGTSITVDGRGLSGACTGDSGGPLLVRSADGAPVVVGILSKGARSCLGRDIYMRVDAQRRWLEERLGAAAAASSPCDEP